MYKEQWKLSKQRDTRVGCSPFSGEISSKLKLLAGFVYTRLPQVVIKIVLASVHCYDHKCYQSTLYLSYHQGYWISLTTEISLGPLCIVVLITDHINMADCGQLSPAPEPARASSRRTGKVSHQSVLTSVTNQSWAWEGAQPIRGRADWSLACLAWASVQSRPQHTTQIGSKHWTIFLTWLYLMQLLTLDKFYCFHSICHVSSFWAMPAPLWWNLILPGGCVSVLVRAGSGFTSQDGLASELLCLC